MDWEDGSHWHSVLSGLESPHLAWFPFSTKKPKQMLEEQQIKTNQENL